MRPRMYYTLRLGFLVGFAILTLVISSMVFSYIIFSIQASGRLFLLGFGAQGLLVFLTLFPWGLLVIDIVLLIGLEQLIQRFRFGYRNPLLYVLTSLAVVSFSFAILITITPIHMTLTKREQQRHLPIIGGFYRHATKPPLQQGVLLGHVTAVSSTTITVKTNSADTSQSDQQWTITLPPNYRASMIFEVGDCVFIAGSPESTSTVRAFGLKKMAQCQ
jgi:hypothetical protein